MDILNRAEGGTLLAGGAQGVEKESLRVRPDGELSLARHPAALGSALTHPHITTDYSEALMEFVTGTHSRAEDLVQELADIHRYVYAEMGDEMLWNQSMPCRLPGEADIPIAWYGTSNSGMLKHVYRRGLAVRYGKSMQCIAGIHFNYSLAPQAWPLISELAGGAQAQQSEGYLALIRNFSRYSWLLMYLFGASPALDAGFMRGREHELQALDENTLYLPWATSLRMSDLGYQNRAQSGLKPCYTDLKSYLDNLYHAVNQPWPPYEAIGTRQNGEWVQLSTHILQIENEYYSSIRPKRVARRGERPLRALHERGVQYVEVRCMDIDPFSPVGFELPAARFLSAFLLMCALDDSPLLPQRGWCQESGDNFALVVKEGRRPGLLLGKGGAQVPLADWAHALLDRIALCAQALDAAHDGGNAHAAALELQRQKIDDPARTPSARVLAGLRETGMSFSEYFLDLGRRHALAFRNQPLGAAERAVFDAESRRSIQEQEELERTQTGNFDDYVAAYHSSLYD
nr:glutamate--cysteine ligase [Verticiella sediminum]